MSEPAMTVLLVDPDTRSRTLLASQLSSIGCRIIEAADGASAWTLLKSSDVKVVVTELYLMTGDADCLIKAVRADRSFRNTRTVAHTHRCLPVDRDWAMNAGADAYLIKPTRAERMRYVVSRLATTRGRNATVAAKSNGDITRRDSLDAALRAVENGELRGTSTIVFGRGWWSEIPKAEQNAFRKRAKQAGVSLRSDSLMKNHYVEIRGRTRATVGLSSEQPESPYRR